MKTFDCLLFNNEFDLLEYRLRLLSGVVTTFVIVEAKTTFQGREKPLHYFESRNRFRHWQPQIRHVVVDIAGAGAGDSWAREHAQHRAFELNLTDASDDDLILVGDCDEIPFPSVIRDLAAEARPPTRLHMQYAIYWANAVRRERWTDGTMAFRWRDRDDPALGVILGHPEAIWGQIPDPAIVAEGGWHVSDLGDVDWIANKLSSFSHTEACAPRMSAPAHMRRCRRLGIDYRSSEPLELLDDDLVPPEIRAIEEVTSSAIRRTAFPARPIRVLYAAFTASRRRLPAPIVAWADRHIVWFLALFGVPIVLGQRLIRPAWRSLRKAGS